jgi:hypothetical protein
MARKKALELTGAWQAYGMDHNGHYPTSLQELLVKDGINGPYLKGPSALVDPWGQLFQCYGTDNSNMPMIFTSGPYGQLIGNW